MARTARRYEAVQYEDVQPGVRKGERTGCPDTPESYSVGIYSRLSVDHDNGKSESIENQIAIIRQYIEAENSRQKNGRKLKVHAVYTDCGISGTSFQREGFGRLMEDVRNHVVDCIMVKDLSRFGRDYVETGNYIEKILPFLGVRFIAVADGFDSMAEDAEQKRLTMHIKNLVNDMYAKDISKRVAAVRQLAAEGGGYIGSMPPYGYKAVKADGVRRLAVQEESAEVVRFLYDSVARGMTLPWLVSALYERKIHRISEYNRYGHVCCKDGEPLRQWNPEVIRGVLSNPVYTGKLVQGRHKSLLREGQKGNRHTDKEQWIVVENSHEPVVSQEQFSQVQQILARRRKDTVGRRRDITERRKDITGRQMPGMQENIFRNVLCCGRCGGKMHAISRKSQAGGTRSYAYECRRAYAMDDRKCDRNYIGEETLESCVTEQIGQILKEQKITSQKLISLNRREWSRAVATYKKEADRLRRERERLAAQAGDKYMQYKEGRITSREYSSFQKHRAEQEKFSEKRAEELQCKIQKSETRMEEEDRFLCSLQCAGGHRDHIKLNVVLVDALIEQIAVFPEGEIAVRFRFGKGGGCHGET